MPSRGPTWIAGSRPNTGEPISREAYRAGAEDLLEPCPCDLVGREVRWDVARRLESQRVQDPVDIDEQERARRVPPPISRQPS